MDIANVTICLNHKCLTISLFFRLFVSTSSKDLASMSAFYFWLSKYLLTACRKKYKENVETISNIQKRSGKEIKYFCYFCFLIN